MSKENEQQDPTSQRIAEFRKCVEVMRELRVLSWVASPVGDIVLFSEEPTGLLSGRARAA